MKTLQICVIGLCVLAPLSFGATPPPAEAVPDAQLNPVIVAVPTPKAVKFDVRAACPAIDAELQRTLSSAWGKVGIAGTMRVQFRLQGSQVTEVHASGMSPDYRPYVRKAVSRLTCSVASAATQDYRFLLVIRDPQDISGMDQFALMTDE